MYLGEYYYDSYSYSYLFYFEIGHSNFEYSHDDDLSFSNLSNFSTFLFLMPWLGPEFLSDESQSCQEKSAQNNEEEGSHLLEAEGLATRAMGVQYLRQGVAAGQIRHHVIYPCVPETKGDTLSIWSYNKNRLVQCCLVRNSVEGSVNTFSSESTDVLAYSDTLGNGPKLSL